MDFFLFGILNKGFIPCFDQQQHRESADLEVVLHNANPDTDSLSMYIFIKRAQLWIYTEWVLKHRATSLYTYIQIKGLDVIFITLNWMNATDALCRGEFKKTFRNHYTNSHFSYLYPLETKLEKKNSKMLSCFSWENFEVWRGCACW